MPIVDTKNQEKRYQVITKQIKLKATENTNEKVSPKTGNRGKKINFLLGAAIPNSTIKGTLIQATEELKTEQKGLTNNPAENYKIQNVDQKIKTIKVSKNFPSEKMIPSSQKLQEITELHKKLVNSSHEPAEKKTSYEPRRPTMEAIKSAIEKAKLMELATNKNVGTEDTKSSITVSDASTQISTQGKSGRKKVKKKYQVQSISTTTTTTTSTTTKTKKPPKSPNKKRKPKKPDVTAEAGGETKK